MVIFMDFVEKGWCGIFIGRFIVFIWDRILMLVRGRFNCSFYVVFVN